MLDPVVRSVPGRGKLDHQISLELSVHMPDRLSLRPLRIEDAVAMVAVLADSSPYKFTGGTPPTRAELARRYAVQARGYSADCSEEWINFIVLVGPQQEAVGFVQATIFKEGKSAEISWVIGFPWQGRGYGGRAAELLVQDLVRREIRRIVAHIHPEHEVSQRIATRLAMAPTSTVVDGEVRWERAITVPNGPVLRPDTE